MPRIQLYQDQMGVQTPRPLTGAADTRGITQGVDAIGRLAQVTAGVALEVKANRERVETARATADAVKAIEEQARYFMEEDRDYATQGERYGQFYKGLESQYQKQFKNNPRMFEAWQQNVDMFAFRKGLAVHSSAMERDMQAQQSTLSSTLNDISGIAVRGDDVQYRESVDRGLALIDQSFDSGVIDERERDKMRQGFQNELARGKVRQDINADPNQALENIRAAKYGGLSADEQSQFEAMALSAIGQSRNKANHQLMKHSKELVSDTLLSFENGYPVSDEEYSAAEQAAALIGREEDLRVARSASKYMLMPKAERDGLPGSIKGVQNAELRLALEKADETITRELDKDGYAFAVRQGVVDRVQIDIQNPATVAARLDQVEYLKSHYGREISPLTNEEADMVVAALPAMTPAVKTQMAMAFGSSNEIWKQLDKKNAGLFAMVGAIGDPNVMGEVFKGQALLQSKMVDLADTRAELLQAFDDAVGDVYVGRDRVAMFEAAQAYYAAQNGPGAERGFFSSDSFEDAIAAVSGGIGTVRGRKVELPRGVDEGDFEDFVDGIDADMVKAFGGVWSMGNERAAEVIRKGSVVSVGSNRYAVEVDGAMLVTNQGEPFMFSFDAQALEEIRKRPTGGRRGR